VAIWPSRVSPHLIARARDEDIPWSGWKMGSCGRWGWGRSGAAVFGGGRCAGHAFRSIRSQRPGSDPRPGGFSATPAGPRGAAAPGDRGRRHQQICGGR
jgi:hypothetical protein